MTVRRDGEAPIRILVVGDDPRLRALLETTLLSEGYGCTAVSTDEDALDWIGAHEVDLIVLDVKPPDRIGRDLVDRLGSADPAIPLIVLTGQEDARIAVDMMKRGARDYLIKDHGLADLLVPVVERVLRQQEREEQLAEAERSIGEREGLARLGEMAAVVAHEVKNPLAAISGAIQVIRHGLPKDSPHAAIIEEILERIDNLNETVNDLLLFARPRSPHLASLPVRSLLEDTVSLLLQDPELREIQVNLSGADLLVKGDAELLKRMFQNLLVNAAQAMQRSGEISILVSRRRGGCQVSVLDDGPGIPPDKRPKVFEPFFTTKARGTGLGLPIAKRIVEAHQGRISIVCPARGGTKVVVELPLEDGGR
ncbi:MAG: response regulator [Planctomycetes bacterium]|nr:response regulator [Planctomycetota bacterium]